MNTKDTKAKKQKVNIFQLYKHASGFEYFLIFFGLICALLQGSALQGPYVFIASTIDDYSRSLNCSKWMNETGDTEEFCNSIISDSAVRVSLGIGICAIIIVITYYLHVFLFIIVADRLARKIRFLAFTNILRQDIGFFDVHFAGELNTRLTQDVTKYEIGIGNKVSMMIAWLSTFITGLVICLIRGWELTLFMCALIPVAIVVSGLTTRLMKIYTEKEMSSYAQAGGVAEEALMNIRVVAAFAGQEKECKRYGALLDEARTVGVKSAIASAFGQGIPWLLTFTISGLTIYFTCINVEKGKINPGFMMVLVGCMMQGLRALGFSAALLENVFDSQGAAFGIYEIIDTKSAIDSSDKKGIKLKDVSGLVTFENVNFSYPARSSIQVLKGLNMEIKPGQSVALVGPSGCGKSTTIQLLQRFYDPNDGVVKFDGIDVKSMNIAWLRSQIGVVSQDPVLFATTIEENIKFGNPIATFEQIKNAAIEADAHEFIMKLPMRYQTVLNEQGTQLSRGEKQRISLARALVRDPKILLLDECTSALDNESEALVQAALDKASKGRTTIIIAHRLSTVKYCDVLFVVNDGIISEFGTHSELLAKEGLYYRLVSTQMTSNKKQSIVSIQEFPGNLTHRQSWKGSMRKKSRVSFSAASFIPEETAEEDPIHVNSRSSGTSIRPLQEMFKLNKKQWPLLLLGVIGGLLLGATWPIYAILLSSVIGIIVQVDSDMAGMEISAFGIIGLGGGACIICTLSIFFLRYFGESLTMIVRSLAYKSMLNQEMAWFDKTSNQVGSLTSRLADEASRVKLATGTTIVYLASAISSVILSVLVSLLSSWQLGLAVLPLMPLAIIAGMIQGYMNTTFEKKSHARTENSGRVASEAIDKIRTIASLTKEPYFIDLYTSNFDDMKKEAQKRANIIGISQSFVWFCSCSIEIVAIGFGMWLVSQKIIELPVVFRILTVALVMAAEVGRANANLPELTSSFTAAENLLKLISRQPLINVLEEYGLKPKQCKGEVEISDVDFNYPARQNVQVLNKFSLIAKKGESIAIVGPSGSGKSTVVQLMERFYDLANGSIKIDGNEINDLNISWLREQLGIVLQEPILFGVSIAENIAYGNNMGSPTMQEIIQASKEANIHDFIVSLPQGYQTNVGSRGTQLSGGQKQRISIARALLRNPKILLLDDATSALDSHSESIVEEALQTARAGRTCIVIAHRLSSIINADCILYMKNGRILEKGTHSKLMSLRGHYYNLYRANLGENK